MKALIIPERVVAISQMPAGARGIIRSLTGGHQCVRRLANLGFTAGAAIEVRQNHHRGPVLVALRGTLIALGRHEAERIFVRAGG